MKKKLNKKKCDYFFFSLIRNDLEKPKLLFVYLKVLNDLPW